MSSNIEAYKRYTVKVNALNTMKVICDTDIATDEVRLVGIENHRGVEDKIFIPSFITSIGDKPFKELHGDINVMYRGGKLKDISGIFEGANGISGINLSNFNTTNIINMSRMFAECENILKINILHLDISKVEKMNEMFIGCKKLRTVYLPDGSAENLKSMKNMFSGCINLKYITMETRRIPVSCEVDTETKTILKLKTLK